MTGYIDLDRDDFFEHGILPRQRKVYVLRWNPRISSFNREGFEHYFSQHKGIIPYDHDDELDWTVWDWKSMEHRDLYIMMQVGQNVNGIVWGGFLGGFPYQYEKEDGSLTRSRFVQTDVEYMHRIEKTGLMTADRLIQAVPEVDWLHGHSGELLPVESAEKLGLFIVNELKDMEEDENIYFESFNQKRYVLADILTVMCPELKKRLLAMGKNKDPEIQDINNLMVRIEDEDYSNWTSLEDHLSLKKLNGVMI